MSLVNDMLRDLEQRNEKPASVPGNQATVKAAQHVEANDQNRLPKIALWCVGAVTLVAALWFISQRYLIGEQATVTVAEQTDVGTSRVAIDVEATQDVQPLREQAQARSVELIKPDQSLYPPEVIQASAAIEQIKWAGTELGGDLVVRLSGDADIQVVSQRDDVIVIAFEQVQLKTSLPMISSPLIQRLDLNKEGDRTLLSLTTQLQSQFSFRVQQNPTTLVLGVVPDQPVLVSRKPESDDLITESVSASPTVLNETTSVREAVATQVAPLKSPIRNGEQLHVQPSTTEEKVVPLVSKPVSKAKTVLTDKQTVARAQQLINKGELNKAEDLLRMAIQERPSKVVGARGLLATLLLSTGETAEAQALIQQSLRLHTSDSTLKKLQARIWLNAGQHNEAAKLLQTNKPAMGNDPEYYELLATTYQQQSKPEASARIYYQLLQLNNQVPRWWIGMGYALEQAQRYSDARNAYQSGLQIPSIAPSLKNYARQRIQALAGR